MFEDLKAAEENLKAVQKEWAVTMKKVNDAITNECRIPDISSLKPLYGEYLEALIKENKAIREELKKESLEREKADQRTFWLSLLSAVVSAVVTVIVDKLIS